ncbi:hypothetical protein [Ruegeria hyattellae]|uniref:hypothetical protein n=1 Tax=Ruegeria hyattellae TaxID=3233337 RepID=UPI00355AD4F2
MASNNENMEQKKATCIAMRGNKRCARTTAEDGAGILCDQHLLLYCRGADLRYTTERGAAENAALRLLRRQINETPFFLKFSTVLAVVFAVSLFVIEHIQIAISKVPTTLTIGGFDVTAAAIHNAGLGVLVFLFALLALGLIISCIFLTYFLGLFIRFWGPAIAMLSYGQLARFLGYLIQPWKANAALTARNRQPANDVGWFRRALNRIRPGLQAERDDALEEYVKYRGDAQRKLKEAKKDSQNLLRWLLNCVVLGQKSHGQVIFGRFISIALIFTIALIFATEIAYYKEGQISKLAVEERDGPAESLRVVELNPISGKIVSKLLSIGFLGQLTAPLPEIGSMTFARQSTPRSTHMGVEPSTTGHGGFRTLRLIHIRNFGDWAWVARVEKPDERVLVRRSTILEFSVDPVPESNTPKSPAATGNTLSLLNGNRLNLDFTFPVVARQEPTDKATIEDLRRRIDRLSSRIDRANAMVNTLSLVSSLDRRSQPELVTVISRMAELQKLLVQDIRKIRTNQNWLAATALGISARLAAVRYGISEFFPQAKPPKGQSAGTPGGQYDSVIQEGMSVRVSGIVNDLLRRNGESYLPGCARGEVETIGYVDFDENHVRISTEPADILGAINKLDRIAKDDTQIQIIFLRGGASYTGSPEANMRISEARAEWVKHQLLKGLVGSTHGDPTGLEHIVRNERGLTLIAFGVGERLHHPNYSSRAVEIIRCSSEAPDRMALQANLE